MFNIKITLMLHCQTQLRHDTFTPAVRPAEQASVFNFFLTFKPWRQWFVLCRKEVMVKEQKLIIHDRLVNVHFSISSVLGLTARRYRCRLELQTRINILRFLKEKSELLTIDTIWRSLVFNQMFSCSHSTFHCHYILIIEKNFSLSHC